MKWEQLLNQFGRDARQQEVEVDKDAIWDAIAPEVDALNKEGRRRKRFVFWIFLLGLLATGGWLLFEEEPLREDQPVVYPSRPSVFPKVVDKNQAIKIVAPSPNATASTTIQEGSNPAVSGIPRSPNTSGTLQTRSAERAPSNAKARTREVTKKEEVLAAGSPSNATPSITEPVEVSKRSTLKSWLAIPPLPNTISYLVREPNPISFSADVVKIIVDPKNQIISATESAPSRRKQKLSYLLTATGGASITRRYLTAKDDSQRALLERREQYETVLEAIHYGIRFGVQHTSGVRISAGLQQISINERLDFQETHVTSDSILGIQSLLLTPAGDTIPLMGIISRTTMTKNKIELYNTYQLLEIPVTVGYHHRFNSRWSAGVEAGILVNIALSTRGTLLDEAGQEIDIETNQDAIFKSTVGMNYQLRLSLGRSLTDAVELNFSPVVHYYANDFSVKTYGLSQRYLTIGADLGLTYQF